MIYYSDSFVYALLWRLYSISCVFYLWIYADLSWCSIYKGVRDIFGVFRIETKFDAGYVILLVLWDFIGSNLCALPLWEKETELWIWNWSLREQRFICDVCSTEHLWNQWTLIITHEGENTFTYDVCYKFTIVFPFTCTKMKLQLTL